MEKSGFSKYIVIAIIILGLFYVGSLNQRVNTLEKNAKSGAGGVANNVADTGSESGSETDLAGAFDESELISLAKSIGLNEGDFETCLNSEEIVKEVQDEQNKGAEIGVNGTPGVFILDNQTGNLAKAAGAVPYEYLKGIVDKLQAGLAEADKTTDPATGTVYSDKTKIALQPLGSSDYVKGDANARFSLIEYSDIDCPYCKRFHPSAQQLVDEYAGQVNWVYRQFPLDQLHPNARVKAQGVRCAGKLGGSTAFWAFLDDIAQ